MTIAEIAEADATGPTADAYGRLREMLDVPVVNFIWRHLATIEGALAFALPVIERAKPTIDRSMLCVSREADAIVSRDGLQDRTTILAPAGVRDVIATYDRGNSWNMLAMTVLAASRRGEALDLSVAEAAPLPPRSRVPKAPPYPRYDALPGDLKAIIACLADAGPAAVSGVRPSLWVHLALWPDVLRALDARCATVLASPAFAKAHADFCGRGADILRLNVPPPAKAAPASEAAIDHAIRIFRLRIAEMVLIGRVLLRDVEESG